MDTLNRLDAWEPGCWCAAITQLCERGYTIEVGNRSSFPAQWAYFVWTPRDKAMPYVAPSGWGILMNQPDSDLAEIIGGAPVYFLKDSEANWPTLLDILLDCDHPPPWLEACILRQREDAAARRRGHWAVLYGDDRPAFEAFMRKILDVAAWPADG